MDINDEKFLDLAKEAEDANRNHFVIVEDADGNYRGRTIKAGKPVFVRAGDPNTVLVELITHNGE